MTIAVPLSMERLKHAIIRTPLEKPLSWLRLAARLPRRLRNPELAEIYWEPVRFERTLARILRRDSNFVDVGAHLGGVLSSVVELAPDGRHIGFEPTPRKAAWLRAKFPEVEISEIAVSDVGGEAEFFDVVSKSAFSGLRSMSSADLDSVSFTVRCETLDNVLPDNYRTDVLKVDVIGA